MLRIGVDIGGTFTDFAIWRHEDDGYVKIGSHKAPTSRPNFAGAVKEGVASIARDHGIGPNDPMLVVHGTTVSTNAVIERSEPQVALITTEGFRDILQIARLRLNKPVDLFNRRPTPLVSRDNVFTIGGRILADGVEKSPLDTEALVNALNEIRARGIEGVGICLVNSYIDARHEAEALRIARERFPEMEIMASHEVWPQQSEYERATLTLLNIYVKRLMRGYLLDISEFLSSHFPAARLYITKSNGGIMSAEEAIHLPVHTLLSGPSAGVTAASNLGQLVELDNILTFDMGGTSADVSLIAQGRSAISGQAEVGDFPLMMPVTAVEAMGAGGGSIIWLDSGVMKVGPRSAGSRPGPACYGLGGEAPTLSDAYLIAGYLPETGLLGGSLALDRLLAEKAFAPVAAALKLSVVETAEASIRVATSGMLARITPFLARLGVGAGDLTLMIFGGAGGVHGPILAEEIGIKRIIIPRTASVFCALGGIVSDLMHDTVKSVQGKFPDFETLSQAFADLEEQGNHWLNAQSEPNQIVVRRHERLAEMRYSAQSFPITVDLTRMFPNGGIEAVASAFHVEHERLFGHADHAAPVSIDTLRVRSSGEQRKPDAVALQEQEGAVEPAERRTIYAAGQRLDNVAVWNWDDLHRGWVGEGPAIIQQSLATILVPQGYQASVGPFGDIDLRKD